MTDYVGVYLRRLVEARAEGLCEYCLIQSADTFVGCQVDHVISQKHGGPTTANNLAHASAFCNVAKGSDIGSLASSTHEFTRLFDPRRDKWSEHFALRGAAIVPLTPIGEVTARLLRFNDADRLLEREALQRAGRYSSRAAAARAWPEETR